MKRLAMVGAVIALFFVGGLAYAAPPGNRTIVVGPDDLADCGSTPAAPTCRDAHRGRVWFFYNDSNDTVDNTIGSFVYCQYGACPLYDASGETPPLGAGSAQISTVLNRRPNLATYQFGGTRLASLTTLRYSTYNPKAGNPGSASRSGYLHFNVDFVGNSTVWQRRLVFVPSDNGAVVQNHWQEWDAINGTVANSQTANWKYSGPSWPAGVGSCVAPGSTTKTWSQILTCYPNSRVLPGDSFLGIRVGEPYPDGYTENIDAFKLGTAAGTLTFDFEPVSQNRGGGHDQHSDDDDGGHGGGGHGRDD